MKQINDEIQPPVKKKKNLLSLLTNVLLPIILVGIFVLQIYTDRKAIRDFDWNFDLTLFFIGMFLLLINTSFEVGIWNKTLSWFTTALPYKLAVPTYIWSSVARYIPGKVASFLVRVGLTSQLGVPMIPMLAASTVELAVRTASGFFMLLLSFLVAKTAQTNIIILAAIIITVVLIVAHPKIMIPIMNWLLRKIKQPQIMVIPKYRSILMVFGLNIFRWIIYGCAFSFICISIYPQAVMKFVAMVGVAPGSWSVGFVSLMPGGIGATEWTQKILLEGMLTLPAEIAMILPILFRLSTLISEGVWSLIGILFWRERGNYVERDQEEN